MPDLYWRQVAYIECVTWCVCDDLHIQHFHVGKGTLERYILKASALYYTAACIYITYLGWSIEQHCVSLLMQIYLNSDLYWFCISLSYKPLIACDIQQLYTINTCTPILILNFIRVAWIQCCHEFDGYALIWELRNCKSSWWLASIRNDVWVVSFHSAIVAAWRPCYECTAHHSSRTSINQGSILFGISALSRYLFIH